MLCKDRFGGYRNMACLMKVNPGASGKVNFIEITINGYLNPFHIDFFMRQRLSFHRDFFLRQQGVYLKVIFETCSGRFLRT